MSRYKWAIGFLMCLALGLVVYTYSGTGGKKARMIVEGEQTRVEQAQGVTNKAGQVKREASVKEAKQAKKKKASNQDAGSGEQELQAAGAGKEEKVDPVKAAAAEKAVEAWEKLVDELVDTKDAPTLERMTSVKEAFDRLDKNDQMDAIYTSLNLLPDEQFTALFGILYDKSENAEVLDAIFSDALNRDEDIKVPMMKELVLDKEHPMFFESARILDVTGELDKMSGQGDPQNENGQEDKMAGDKPAAEQ